MKNRAEQLRNWSESWQTDADNEIKQVMGSIALIGCGAVMIGGGLVATLAGSPEFGLPGIAIGSFLAGAYYKDVKREISTAMESHGKAVSYQAEVDLIETQEAK